MYGSEWLLVACMAEDIQTIYNLLFNNEEFFNMIELIYVVITLLHVNQEWIGSNLLTWYTCDADNKIIIRYGKQQICFWYFLLPSPALSITVKTRDLMIRQPDMSSPKVDGTHSLLFPNAPV